MPVKVSCGLGVNSTAVLVALQRAGIRPDAILFADTGCEMPATYAYEPILQRWLAAVGFPLLDQGGQVVPHLRGQDTTGRVLA